jgi:hypothetical protein
MSFGTYSIATQPYGGGAGGTSIVYYSISHVSPADASSSTVAKPTFTAHPVTSDGSNASIEWQWDTNVTFTNPNSLYQTKTTAGNVSDIDASTTPDTAFQSYTWYWRVRAGDGASNWSDYTAPWSLAVTSPIAMTSTTYIYENVGLAPAVTEDTEDAHMYIYENVGVATPLTEDTEDANMYIYENVQTRPAGSKETLPPTHN